MSQNFAIRWIDSGECFAWHSIDELVVDENLEEQIFNNQMLIETSALSDLLSCT